MTIRDLERLQGVDPRLQTAYQKLSAAAAALGFGIFVVEGLRTQARQIALYEQGRSMPGRIVTKVDGVTKLSNHQRGRALDFAFSDDPRTPRDETWDPAMPWALIGTMAKVLGVVWGGDWGWGDFGHIELKEDQ